MWDEPETYGNTGEYRRYFDYVGGGVSLAGSLRELFAAA
jgi:hypothetical protein